MLQFDLICCMLHLGGYKSAINCDLMNLAAAVPQLTKDGFVDR